MATSKLSQKQKAFIREYLIDLNATSAAKRAGYSEKSAAQDSSRMLANAKMAEAVKLAISKRAAKAEVKSERVLTELASLAFSDMRHYIQWDGEKVSLLPSHLIPDGAAAAIKEVRQDASGVVIKLHDKTAALRDLARHLGVLPGGELHDGGKTAIIVIAPGAQVPAAEEQQRIAQVVEHNKGQPAYVLDGIDLDRV